MNIRINGIDLGYMHDMYAKQHIELRNKDIKKKEGNKMIESLNLVDLFEKRFSEKIYEDTNKKIKKIKESNEIIKKIDEIMEKAEKALNDLYLSQLSDEDLERIKNGEVIDSSKYPFERYSKIELCYEGCSKNINFENDEIKAIKKDADEDLQELKDLVKTVKAHVGIAKTKEEVEEILTKYGILDKKGKLVCK
jgi:hypothetical protein